MNFPKVMKSIDTFLFNQVDNLMQTSEFLKLSESYAGFEEKAQEATKIILMMLTLSIPVIIVLTFYSINNSKADELALKDELINTANTLIQESSLISSEERQLLSKNYIGSESSLKNTINSSLSLISIDSQKVQVSGYNIEELDGLITKVRADLSFKGLTSEGLFALLDSLNSKFRIRMEDITIRKNEISNSLDGVIAIAYFSKDTSLDE
jgi:hypothetical protein